MKTKLRTPVTTGSHDTFTSDLIAKINPEILLPLVEEMIDLEKTTLQANLVFDDESKFLKNEIRISQAQILLSLLRVRFNSLGS